MKLFILALSLFFADSVWAGNPSLMDAMRASADLGNSVRAKENELRLWCDTSDSTTKAVKATDYFGKPTTAWKQTIPCYNMAKTEGRFCQDGRYAGKAIEVLHTYSGGAGSGTTTSERNTGRGYTAVTTTNVTISGTSVQEISVKDIKDPKNKAGKRVSCK